VGAGERTVRGWGGGERHGVDAIGCGELRREPHERAREGARPPDMGGDGLGSEGGGGRAERVGRHEGGGSNDGKMSRVRYGANGALKNAGPRPFSPPRPTQRPGAGCLFRHSLPLSPLRPQPHPYPRRVPVKNR